MINNRLAKISIDSLIGTGTGSRILVIRTGIMDKNKLKDLSDCVQVRLLQLDPLAYKFSWLYYLMIEATQKTGNFRTKLFHAQQYFTLTQGDMALEEYHELLNSAAKAILHNFDSKDPMLAGYVRLKMWRAG